MKPKGAPSYFGSSFFSTLTTEWDFPRDERHSQWGYFWETAKPRMETVMKIIQALQESGAIDGPQDGD